MAAAAMGLGAVVNGASAAHIAFPLASLQNLFGPVANGHRPEAAAVVAAGIVVGLALVFLRVWPVALLIGSALTLPDAVATFLHSPSAAIAVFLLAGLGTPMALVAVLGAAQDLIGRGATRAGIVLAGATAGAGLAGATLPGSPSLGTPWDLNGPHLALALVATAGGALAAAMGPVSGRRPGLTATLAGALAAPLVFVPVLVTAGRISMVLQVSERSVSARPYVVLAITGMATLGAAALLAAVPGVRTFLGAAAAALVQIGVIGIVILLLFVLTFEPAMQLGFVLAGLVIGCAAAATPWRTGLAAAGCVVVALALLLLSAATSGLPEKLITRQASVPAALLLMAIAAAVTCTTAAAAPAIALRGGLPAVLGPIVALLAVGGGDTLTLTQLDNGIPQSTYLTGAHHLGPTVVVLFVAAAATVGAGLARPARTAPAREAREGT
jgi:hypothetical protein